LNMGFSLNDRHTEEVCFMGESLCKAGTSPIDMHQ